MAQRLEVISEYFGPSFISDGSGRRMSFVEAWRDPQLRKRAIIAANRELNAKRREVGKAPSRESEQIALIANLLFDALAEEGGL